MKKSELRKLLLVLCMALAVELLQLFLVFTVSGDAYEYINVAKSFYAGNFKLGLIPVNHPLYPLLIALTYNITHNWVIAGQTVSFIFGLLTVFPVYFLAKDIFKEKIAVLTAVFFAFHPFVCKYSVVIMSEAVYIFLFTCSVWLGWRAISRQKYSLFFVAGLIAGINYINRPEAIGIPALIVLYIIFYNLGQLKKNYKKMLISICLLSIGTLIFASPYMVYIKSQSGKWQLSRKKNLTTAILGVKTESQPQRILPYSARIPAYSRMDKGYFSTLGVQIFTFVKVYSPIFFLLFLFGFVRRKTIPWNKKAELFLCLIIIFYILISSLFYVSDRHLVPLVPICLCWAAIGFYELYYLILAKLSLFKINVAPAFSNKVFFILLIGVIITLLPYLLKPQDRDKVGQKKVGEWMKENCKKNPFILTDLDRLVFYADGYFVSFQNRPGIDNFNDLINYAKTPEKDSYGYNKGTSHCIDYIVIDKSRIGNYCSDFLNSVNTTALEQIYIQPKLEHSNYGDIIVYKVK